MGVPTAVRQQEKANSWASKIASSGSSGLSSVPPSAPAVKQQISSTKAYAKAPASTPVSSAKTSKATKASVTVATANKPSSTSLNQSSSGSGGSNSGAADIGTNLTPALTAWCKQELAKISDTTDLTLVQFCSNIDSPQEIIDTMKATLGSTAEVTKFAKEFIVRKEGEMGFTSNSKKKKGKNVGRM